MASVTEVTLSRSPTFRGTGARPWKQPESILNISTLLSRNGRGRPDPDARGKHPAALQALQENGITVIAVSGFTTLNPCNRRCPGNCILPSRRERSLSDHTSQNRMIYAINIEETDVR